MHKTSVNFLYTTGTLKDRLGANAVPVQLPIGAEDQFEGIIDLINMEAHFYVDDLGTVDEAREIPAEYLEKAEELREQLVEAVAELDEDLRSEERREGKECR